MRIRLGLFGYTAGGRRRPQTYNGCEESRNRRAAYAARYEREKLRGDGLRASETIVLIAALLFLVLLSPIILPVYLIRRLVRAMRRTPSAPDTSAANVVAEEGVPVEYGDDELLDTAPTVAVPQNANREEGQAQRPPGWTIKGSTTPEFAGVTLPTLRAWLRFWKNPLRSVGRAEEMARENPELYAGRTREDHVQLIEAEIEARNETVGKRRPGRPAGLKR